MIFIKKEAEDMIATFMKIDRCITPNERELITVESILNGECKIDFKAIPYPRYSIAMAKSHGQNAICRVELIHVSMCRYSCQPKYLGRLVDKGNNPFLNQWGQEVVFEFFHDEIVEIVK
jgi:hypothetical protein